MREHRRTSPTGTDGTKSCPDRDCLHTALSVHTHTVVSTSRCHGGLAPQTEWIRVRVIAILW